MVLVAAAAVALMASISIHSCPYYPCLHLTAFAVQSLLSLVIHRELEDQDVSLL